MEKKIMGVTTSVKPHIKEALLFTNEEKWANEVYPFLIEQKFITIQSSIRLGKFYVDDVISMVTDIMINRDTPNRIYVIPVINGPTCFSYFEINEDYYILIDDLIKSQYITNDILFCSGHNKGMLYRYIYKSILGVELLYTGELFVDMYSDHLLFQGNYFDIEVSRKTIGFAPWEQRINELYDLSK